MKQVNFLNKEENNKDIIAGRNTVSEALKSGRSIDTLYVAKGELTGSVKVIAALAKEKHIPVKEVDRKKLDFMTNRANHQGIVALAAVKDYSSVDDIFELARQRDESPFVIVLDGIEDPHNLGAIIRTAECAGAHGVIIPSRRAAGLNFTVGKSSAGALEYVPVARVTNIAAAIDDLKQRGCWVYGADMDGQTYCEAKLDGASALVIGAEGRGLGRLVREKCDVILSLPMLGKINSLNASVAGSILMYEAMKQRLKTE